MFQEGSPAPDGEGPAVHQERLHRPGGDGARREGHADLLSQRHGEARQTFGGEPDHRADGDAAAGRLHPCGSSLQAWHKSYL